MDLQWIHKRHHNRHHNTLDIQLIIIYEVFTITLYFLFEIVIPLISTNAIALPSPVNSPFLNLNFI